MAHSENRLRICFVSPTSYPVMARVRDIPFVGGAEVQQTIISQELARRGHEVSMITMDHGQAEGEIVSGVRMLKMHAPSEGLPMLRFLHPRLSSLWRAMGRADADVYYQRAAGAITGFVVGFARAHARRAIYASASNLEFDKGIPQVRYARDRYLFRYGIRNASRIIVQNEWQKYACKMEFGRDPDLIHSCYGHQGAPGKQTGEIIWVGSIKAVKRPEIFLDLAQHMPSYRFKMIGGPARHTPEYEQLLGRAESLGNVEMTGFVPFADVESHFDGASILVNTSINEGFPNTFLQAWSRGIPTVSFFDVGARTGATPVGQVVRCLGSMVRALNQLKSDVGHWQQKSSEVKSYFLQNHTVDEVVNNYEKILRPDELNGC